MDGEIRDSFGQVFKKLDDVHSRISDIHVELAQRVTKTETCLQNHCEDSSIHIQPEAKDENGNSDKMSVRFRFPRRWLLVIFYIVLALFGGVGFKDVLKFLADKI